MLNQDLNQFLEIEDKILNLQNISNVNILKNRRRIVFNMKYSIEIDSEDKHSNKKIKKMISDYVYLDSKDKAEFNENLSNLKMNSYFKKYFLKGTNYNYINVNCISSIKFSEDKLRTIFNLSNSVSFNDFNKNQKLTSEFIFVNHDSYEDFIDYKESLKELLIY